VKGPGTDGIWPEVGGLAVGLRILLLVEQSSESGKDSGIYVNRSFYF
jgi:hypothetical protein